MFVNDMFEGKIGDKLVARAQQDAVNFGMEQINDELPPMVKNLIPMNEVEDHFYSLSGTNTEKARAIGSEIEHSIISIVSNVFGYLIAFVFSFVICTIAIFLLDKFFELPAFGWLNRIGGVFWGAANAYLTASFLVCVIALIFGNDFVNGTIVTKIIYYFGLFTF